MHLRADPSEILPTLHSGVALDKLGHKIGCRGGGGGSRYKCAILFDRLHITNEIANAYFNHMWQP